MTAVLLERTFGSFHAVFIAAAAMYLSGAALWLVIDPRRPALMKKDANES
jgi:hypothetical protein